jgi:hypothetical protein
LKLNAVSVNQFQESDILAANGVVLDQLKNLTIF